jgi:hypothetical protein
MDEPITIPYAVVQRLRLIDVLLDNDAPVNRRILTDYFGISTVQASNDLKQYSALKPDNMTYDLRRKTYVATFAFTRIWT